MDCSEAIQNMLCRLWKMHSNSKRLIVCHSKKKSLGEFETLIAQLNTDELPKQLKMNNQRRKNQQN